MCGSKSVNIEKGLNMNINQNYIGTNYQTSFGKAKELLPVCKDINRIISNGLNEVIAKNAAIERCPDRTRYITIDIAALRAWTKSIKEYYENTTINNISKQFNKGLISLEEAKKRIKLAKTEAESELNLAFEGPHIIENNRTTVAGPYFKKNNGLELVG